MKAVREENEELETRIKSTLTEVEKQNESA